MPRLIDDIRAVDCKLQMPFFIRRGFEDHWIKMAHHITEPLMHPQLPVLLIDNVADYYYASEQEYWDMRKDFPNLAPPYPCFWTEHKMPRKIHSKEKGDTDLTHFVQRGRQGALIFGLRRDQCTGVAIPDNAHWVLWCELFLDYGCNDCTAEGPCGSIFVAVDADRACIHEPTLQTYCDPQFNDVLVAMMTYLHPTFLAISFLHCKNVTLIDNTVPPPLAKKYQTRHGVKPTGFRTLVIEPLKQVLRHEGRAGEVGVQRALHICRGHFRDYREGRGLFGKYHQLVWNPQTVRGSKGIAPPPREIRIKV